MFNEGGGGGGGGGSGPPIKLGFYLIPIVLGGGYQEEALQQLSKRYAAILLDVTGMCMMGQIDAIRAQLGINARQMNSDELDEHKERILEGVLNDFRTTGGNSGTLTLDIDKDE